MRRLRHCSELRRLLFAIVNRNLGLRKKATRFVKGFTRICERIGMINLSGCIPFHPQRSLAMKTRRTSILFAAAVTLASIGIFGAATPASADPLCQVTEEQCTNGCPDAGDCNKGPAACQKMRMACLRACLAQFKACQRKHPG
jgi:hypothetical protein